MDSASRETSIEKTIALCNECDENKLWLYEGWSLQNEHTLSSTSPIQYPKTAIIIQGPLVSPKITKLALEFYVHYHSSSPIIIVTWENGCDACLGIINHFRSVYPNIYLHQLPPPDHIDSNLQIISTQYGIYKAKRLGCDFVLKSRSDMLFGRSDVLFKFHSLLVGFNRLIPSSMRSKIIVGSTNSFMARPYCVSDFFSFGHIADMELMWTLPLSDGGLTKDNISVNYVCDDQVHSKMTGSLLTSLKDTVYRVSRRRSEHYITSNLLKVNGLSYSDCLHDYYLFMASCFIVVDSSMLGLCWPKYGHTTADYKYRRGWALISEYLDTPFRMKEWTFPEWLHHYTAYSS